MSLASGTRLGPYEIVAPLGSGGMGDVYRARDPRLARDVAIKVIATTSSSEPDRFSRFEREARAAAALNHPNILAVYDIGSHEGTPYVVSELLAGETLRARLNGLSVRKAVEYALQIARGLAAAHERGIVHRDLKPENIFVTTDGHVKILDFGLAKLTETEPTLAGVSQLMTSPAGTQPGLLLGTVGYMAPEQIRGQPTDHRADVFAFGAILYEMLSGQRSFGGATPADTISAILDRNPPDLPVADRHIPPALARVVDRCLEKDPAARFQSTRDLAFALEALDAGSSTTASIAARAGRRRPDRLAWGIALLAVITAAAVTEISVRRSTPPPLVTQLELTTTATSDPFSFALSPDGRQIAFVATAEGGSRIWVRALDQPTGRPLAGTEGAILPFWAADGRAIGFFADAKLKRIDLSAGAAQVLADAPLSRGGTWNRDGVILFASIGSSGLMRVPASGGPATAVTRLSRGQVAHRWPQFLPDGRHFLFYSQGNPDVRGVYLGSLDGGDPKRVIDSEAAAMYVPPGFLFTLAQSVLSAVRFDPTSGSTTGDPVPIAQSVGVDGALNHAGFGVSDGGVIAYRSGAAARRQVVWVDRAGTLGKEIVPSDETNLTSPELSPEGERLAFYRTTQNNTDLWVMPLARTTASRFTFDAAIEACPLWSPDGTRIVFRSSRNGRYDLFEKPASGAADEHPLLVTMQDKSPQSWSPDGRLLLYSTADPRTQSDLWALPLDGDRKPFPVVQTGADEVHGQFSPDGRWLAYTSNESGRYEVYVRSFPAAGGRWQISSNGGIYPRWRRDGRELFFVAPDNRIMAAVMELDAKARTLTPGAPQALFSTRLSTQGSAGLAGFGSKAQYDVARDGRFVLIASADEAIASPIKLILNWDAALKKP